MGVVKPPDKVYILNKKHDVYLSQYTIVHVYLGLVLLFCMKDFKIVKGFLIYRVFGCVFLMV